MEFEDLNYEQRGQLVTISLARPDARNAYSEGMVRSLVEALARAQADDDARCVVLTGEGSAFSAGGDLKLMRDHAGMFAGQPDELRRRYIDGIQRIPAAIQRFEKPLIAAVNGPAIGAGLDLACMCDLRIASEEAKFGSTFVKVGLVPGDGGAYFLTRAVGYARALDLMLTGRVIDAPEALQIGLVQRLAPAEELMTQALALAESIAANAPVAVRLTKRAAVRGYDADVQVSLELAATYQGVAQNTADHDEAVRAMLERRTPKFQGK
jgi:2-(1,2-epoxy-1,2-dihydrophenyl)acetyl-CoA isomerase